MDDFSGGSGNKVLSFTLLSWAPLSSVWRRQHLLPFHEGPVRHVPGERVGTDVSVTDDAPLCQAHTTEDGPSTMSYGPWHNIYIYSTEQLYREALRDRNSPLRLRTHIGKESSP